MAVVEDEAGTTRDRLYGDGEWNGRRFVIVDTGGLELAPGDVIEMKVQEQARLAIREADAIVFVVDAATGLTPADVEAAEVLRLAKAPVIVAVNKADNQKRDLEAAEFYEMGWDEIHPISASHGRGTGDLLDSIVWALPPESAQEIARKEREREADLWSREEAAGRLEAYVVGVDEDDDEDAAAAAEADDEITEVEAGRRWDALIAAESDDTPVGIAIVGRPNVGKSSLLNALLGEERAIVSDIPGTTRDATDTPLEWGRSTVVLIDTAGVKRRGKVASGPAAEKHSTLRSLRAITRSDVAVLVIDAVEGLTAQDAHVAGYVVDEGRGPGRRGEQVGSRRRQDRQDLRPVRRVDPQRGAIPGLRADPLDQREDRPARRPRARGGDRRLGRAPQARSDRRAQPAHQRGRGSRLGAGREGPPTQDLLRHPGRRRTADVRVLRARRELRALQLPALPREPPAGGLRLRRHADPAGLPRALVGEAAAAEDDVDEAPAGRVRHARRRRGREVEPRSPADVADERSQATATTPRSARSPGRAAPTTPRGRAATSG